MLIFLPSFPVALIKKRKKLSLNLVVEPFLEGAWAGRAGVGWPAWPGEWARRPAPGTGTGSQLQLQTQCHTGDPAIEERTSRTEPPTPSTPHHRTTLVYWTGILREGVRWKDTFLAEKSAFHGWKGGFCAEKHSFRPEKRTFQPEKTTFQLKKVSFQCPYFLWGFGLRTEFAGMVCGFFQPKITFWPIETFLNTCTLK